MSGRAGTGIALLALAALAGLWLLRSRPATEQVALVDEGAAAEDSLRAAFDEHAQGRVILVRGRVERTLADDRDGSPHQRFIIGTDSGLTVLIAHNLDLAPRLEGLAPGELVTVLGEYEWNEKGGLMHWTHDDPQGQHVAGYIDWRGKRYQ